MESLIAFGLAAGAALLGAEASAPVAAPAVTGSVTFKGEKPELKPLVIEESKSVGCVHEGAVDNTDQSLIIGENGGVANVVVMVMVKGAEAKASDAPLQLDQESCRFEPHVTVVAEGTTVEFLNSDGISHNVHTYAQKNDGFNKIISAGSKETQKLDKADRIEIKCDIHPWMNAWLIVTDAPFFAVTDEKGQFHIEGLPEGTHAVEFWHEKLGKEKGEITVAADGSGTLTKEWSLEEKGDSGRRGRR